MTEKLDTTQASVRAAVRELAKAVAALDPERSPGRVRKLATMALELYSTAQEYDGAFYLPYQALDPVKHALVVANETIARNNAHMGIPLPHTFGS